ncbi:hypothetical protein [Paeniglutamicibacter terrestris]|uniref:Uncharacterized protein n=1 Tax=Paeniglutamicibacter terrestris TaxID=2723403 RepID=A0ABX1G832_9MICC|nr:hypothetical protein [Paeniglutamicibacter terrestris]NKG22204.1 hypothetical protein [Paeniglutamicibacter terrestris]
MTNKRAIPAQEIISKSGDRLEITGIVISFLCLAIGVVSLFNGGNGIPLVGIVLGLLLMITGYAKKTSAATMAMFIMQSVDRELATENKASTQQ